MGSNPNGITDGSVYNGGDEAAVLRERIRGLEAQLEEKERIIQILMKK